MSFPRIKLWAVVLTAVVLGAGRVESVAENASHEARLLKGEVLISYREARDIHVHEVKGEILCEGPPELVWSVITDYPAYPRIFPDILSVRVVERRSDGVRLKVRSNNLYLWPYSLQDYIMLVKENKTGFLLSWRLEKGNIRTLYGSCLLEPLSKDPNKTKVTYLYAYDPGWFVPAFTSDLANRSTVIDRLIGLRKEVRKRKKDPQAATPNVGPKWKKAPFWWQDNQENPPPPKPEENPKGSDKKKRKQPN